MTIKLFKSLLLKVLRIEKEIEQEQKSGWRNHLRLVQLKKARLAVKDHIQELIRNSQRKSNMLLPQPALLTVKNKNKSS